MNSLFERAAGAFVPLRARISAARGVAASLVASLALLISPSQAAAQSSPTPTVNLRPVVVTAQRSPQRVDELLADVSVIDRDSIERSGVAGVGDLLARLPGVQMARNGGPGGTTSIYIRGAETRQVLVVIDGIRVDSQSTGGAPWEALPISQIDRIEVLRGAACAVWGSDAMGGVVQIFTKQPGSSTGEPVIELGLGLGQQRSWRAEASARGRVDRLDWALAAGREGTRGFNARPGYNSDIDGLRASTVSAQLGLHVDELHRLDVSAISRHMNAQYDGSTTRDDHALHDLDNLSLGWSARWLPALRSRVQVGESRDRYETLPSPYLTETRVRTLMAQVDGDVVNSWGRHRLDAQVEQREDLLVNSSIGAGFGQGRRSRTQDGLALGWRWSQGAASLQSNLRQDQDSEFGGHATGSLAAGWKLSEDWRVSASAGNSYRAPTLYQRYSQYGPASGSTAGDLRPEQGRTQEAALHWDAGNSRASLVAYRQRFDNLITFGAAGICNSSFGCYRNLAKASVRGLTLQGQTRWAGLRLNGSIDGLNPRNDDSGKLQPRRARRTAFARAEGDVSSTWALGAQVQAAGTRWDNAANTIRLPGYALLDLDAQWRINPEWHLQLSLGNALDKQYQTANGFANSPRNLFVMLRWQPKL